VLAGVEGPVLAFDPAQDGVCDGCDVRKVITSITNIPVTCQQHDPLRLEEWHRPMWRVQYWQSTLPRMVSVKVVMLETLSQVFLMYLKCDCLLLLSPRESGHLCCLVVNPVSLILSRRFVSVGVKKLVSFKVKDGGNTAVARIEGRCWQRKKTEVISLFRTNMICKQVSLRCKRRLLASLDSAPSDGGCPAISPS
jgi:hypothetical protein